MTQARRYIVNMSPETHDRLHAWARQNGYQGRIRYEQILQAMLAELEGNAA
jgi:hypothetical protein